MTRFNFTIQDNSPFLSYTGLWLPGTSDDDQASQYDGSFTVTQHSAKATFDFVGTGASIFGAFRPNHGIYSVDLDQSGNPTSSNGGGPNKFQVPLWSAYGLANKKHTVEVTNEPSDTNPFFDVDFISIEREIGQDGSEIFDSMINDTAPEVQYQGSWSMKQSKRHHNGSTLHSTTIPGSQVNITFQGCCIEVYGFSADAPYSVSLDSQPPTNMQGLGVDVDPPGHMSRHKSRHTSDHMSGHPPTLLYLMDGLSEDAHTVSLTVNQNTGQHPFSFDYAVSRSSKKNIHSGLSRGARIGLGVALSLGIVVLLGLIIGAFLLRRRRRRTHPVSHVDLMASKLEPYDVVHNPPWLSLRHAAPRSDATFQFSSVISGWGRLSGIDERSDTDQRRASTRWRSSSGISSPNSRLASSSGIPNSRWAGFSGTPNSRWAGSSGAPSSQRGSIPPPLPPKAVTQKPRKGDVMRGGLQLSRPRESVQTASGVPPAYDPSWDSQSSSQR